ncbi:hypothetical protein IJD34_00950, partial [bacterium]|nr:hypothetical protein [bacterium]
MSEGSYNFGLITTSPINIGEEIQSLAAMRFLPQIDEYIHREHVSKYRSSNKKLTKLWLAITDKFSVFAHHVQNRGVVSSFLYKTPICAQNT